MRGFLQGNVMPAFDEAFLRIPSKCCEKHFIRLHRPAVEHRHPRKLPERLVLQQFTDQLAHRTI